MFNIKILPQAYQKIDMYTLHYRNYFENLYRDSGTWNEEKIVSNYRLEAEERYFQILDILREKLSDAVHLSKGHNDHSLEIKNTFGLFSRGVRYENNDSLIFDIFAPDSSYLKGLLSPIV